MPRRFMTRPSYRDSLNRRYILFLFLPRTTRTRRFAAPLVARTPLGTTRTTRTTRTTNASVRSRAALAALTTTHSTDRRRRAEELFDSKKRRTETIFLFVVVCVGSTSHAAAARDVVVVVSSGCRNSASLAGSQTRDRRIDWQRGFGSVRVLRVSSRSPTRSSS